MESKVVKFIDTESRIVIARGWGRRVKWGHAVKGYKILLNLQDE